MVPPTIAPTWDLCEAVTVEPDIALVGEGEVDEGIVVLRVSSGCIEIVGAGIFVAGWLPRLSVEAVLPSGPTISGKSDPWSALQSSLGFYNRAEPTLSIKLLCCRHVPLSRNILSI